MEGMMTWEWKMCLQGKRRTCSPSAISFKQIGQVLSTPSRVSSLTVMRGMVLIASSVAPCREWRMEEMGRMEDLWCLDDLHASQDPDETRHAEAEDGDEQDGDDAG
jgi:hypothetical protein